MNEVQQQDMDDIGGIAISHTAIICALLTVLKRKGVLDAVDIDDVFEIAATTLEGVERTSPQIGRNARLQLDHCASNFVAQPPRRRSRA